MTEVQRFTREEFATELEAAGSQLCDCTQADSPPINPANGAPIDHHCDCAAVYASATIRRGETDTRHARQCGCFVVDDSVRRELGLPPLTRR